MSSLQSAEGVIKPEGSILNVERASTSASMGKKGKKNKPSAKGLELDEPQRLARAKKIVSNVGYLATRRGTAWTS